MNAPLLEVRGMSKRYGRVQANDNVGLILSAGEVHALLGENGAGKSTLAKILYGYTTADSGEILLSGRRADIRSPRDAREHRIGMVFQNLMLIPALSVLENIALFLNDLPAVIRPGDIDKRIRDVGERFGIVVDSSAPVRQLSIGDRQKVEILKLLLAEARILLFDEPTKVLAPHEAEALFRVFEALKTDGYAILFITHKLREVMRCADRITVMRQGRVTATFAAGQADIDTLVTKMFGAHRVGEGTQEPRQQAAEEAAGSSATLTNSTLAHATCAPSSPARRAGDRRAGCPHSILELRGASATAAGSETPLRDLNLAVAAGEIVGVAGVSGSGQKELGDLILGMRPLAAGTKWFCGQNASSWSIARLRDNGVAFIPEDPLAMAAVAGMPVRENLSLGTGARYHEHLGIDWTALESSMAESFSALDFPMPPLEMPAGALSGGNLQRVVIAREMAHAPKLIVALYPTRGLDVLSAASVRELLRHVCDRGAGVLLISEDLDELGEVADRVLVMFAGSIAGEFPRGRWTPDEVGHVMTGSTEAHLV